MVQLDSPSILTVCLSKCLHGTGWGDSLVDNLSVFYYEKDSHAIYSSRNQQMDNTHIVSSLTNAKIKMNAGRDVMKQ